MPTDLETDILQTLFNQERYGREIRDEVERITSKKIPLGTLYTTLHRMEQKGYVESRFGESAHARGGNRRKFFKITADGNAELQDLAQRLTRLGGLIGG